MTRNVTPRDRDRDFPTRDGASHPGRARTLGFKLHAGEGRRGLGVMIRVQTARAGRPLRVAAAAGRRAGPGRFG